MIAPNALALALAQKTKPKPRPKAKPKPAPAPSPGPAVPLPGFPTRTGLDQPTIWGGGKSSLALALRSRR